MATMDLEKLRNIKAFPELVKYLRDELDWPIEQADFEDLFFEYDPDELGIDSKSAAKIDEIKQLRPLADSQPWGIFFIRFAPKRLPVVALRRILSSLAMKKRANARTSEMATWQLNDLLFISNYGESTQRQITFAHFSQEEQSAELPTLRVLGWDDADTVLHIDHVHSELQKKLVWPKNEKDIESWRSNWASAFTLGHHEVITTSKELAIRLAALARQIRKRASSILSIETEKGPIRKLHHAFRESLIHDLSEDDFADMYAQTIAYGLLSARLANPKGRTADELTVQIPVTNPFLKELMETFLNVGGRKAKAGGGGIDFDELGISEVVDLLNNSNMEAVIRDFGDKNPQEDPVIHFYELFLKEYDAQKRMQRGVFYTPRPVVSYIVRSVDELLRTEFGLEDGLADITTWGKMVKRHKDLKIPEGISPDQDFIQILDPATGTGTFLVEAIDLIHKTLVAKWKKEGHAENKRNALWNEYVPKHLLTRLYGYELLMAPYAIAHLKIGLKLYETGYHFDSGERARVYLSNALEPAQDFSGRFEFASPALAHEAQAVNSIKSHTRFTIIIGNPPYSGISSNMSEQAQRIIDNYRTVDGAVLKEKKIWLQDDYVKFIRLVQITLEAVRIGIVGCITNHGYLNNPTFRGMRQSLMMTFKRIRVLDLHGNANKKEKSPDGSEDKNVFDIKQGVAIFLASLNEGPTIVSHKDLWGSRENKYIWLAKQGLAESNFSPLIPDSPYYFFEPQNISYRTEYNNGWKLSEAMSVNCAGFITARDHFVIDFDKDALLKRILAFANLEISDANIRRTYFEGYGSNKYPDGDTRGWKIPAARRRVADDNCFPDRVRLCLYRPFDFRQVYWAEWMIDWPRPELTRHLDLPNNRALITTRITKDVFSAFTTLLPPGHKSVGSYDVNYVFPLWVVADQSSLFAESIIRPNFSIHFLISLADCLGLGFEGPFNLPKGVPPEDIFQYIYAVLHSPCYRSRYAEFLKIDFPRLPLPGSLEFFHALASLGGELVSLHLLESPKVGLFITAFMGAPTTKVEKITYSEETVWLDKAQTAGFKGVLEDIWNFHIGGYQVCEKWLKDRKGRTLSEDDISHYQKIVVALSETIRIMKEIDRVIEEHGGWPGAFHHSKSST